MKIIKRDGSRQEFDENKIKTGLIKAGATERVAEHVANEVASQVHEGMTTEEIRKLIIKKLGELDHR
jgi:transcriptional regulator NrdR family protein